MEINIFEEDATHFKDVKLGQMFKIGDDLYVRVDDCKDFADDKVNAAIVGKAEQYANYGLFNIADHTKVRIVRKLDVKI